MKIYFLKSILIPFVFKMFSQEQVSTSKDYCPNNTKTKTTEADAKTSKAAGHAKANFHQSKNNY